MKLESASTIFLYTNADVACLQITKKLYVRVWRALGRL